MQYSSGGVKRIRFSPVRKTTKLPTAPRMNVQTKTAALSLALCVMPGPLPLRAASAGEDFFEKRIRPVLVERCYKCHSATSEKLKGGLHLDSRDGSLAFASSTHGAVPPGPWDAIVIVDVLYLLDADHELALLDGCLAELAPGGVLVVKETDVVPRLKHAIAKAQELLATRVLRITAGDALSVGSHSG